MAYIPQLGYDPALAGVDNMGWGWQDVVKNVINPLNLVRQIPGAGQLIPAFDPVQRVLDAALPSQPAYRPQPPAQPQNAALAFQQSFDYARQIAAQRLAAQRAAQQAAFAQELQQVAPAVTAVGPGRDVIFQVVGTIDSLVTTAQVQVQPTEGLLPRRASAVDYDGTATAAAAGTVLLSSFAIGSTLQSVGNGGIPFAVLSPLANNVLPLQFSPIPTSQICQALFTRTVAPGAGATRVCVLSLFGPSR